MQQGFQWCRIPEFLYQLHRQGSQKSTSLPCTDMRCQNYYTRHATDGCKDVRSFFTHGEYSPILSAYIEKGYSQNELYFPSVQLLSTGKYRQCLHSQKKCWIDVEFLHILSPTVHNTVAPLSLAQHGVSSSCSRRHQGCYCPTNWLLLAIESQKTASAKLTAYALWC